MNRCERCKFLVQTASSVRLLDHLVYDHDLPNAKAVRVVNYIYTGKIRARTFFEFIKRWLRLPWQKSVDPLDRDIATLRAMKETGILPKGECKGPCEWGLFMMLAKRVSRAKGKANGTV